MNESVELLVKAALCAFALLAMLWRAHSPGKLAPHQAGWPLLILAVLSAFAWINFGVFHGRSAVHHWEQFHYFLGSKYAPEVRYDGLYDASLAAEFEIAGTLRQPYTRDLRSNEVVPTATLLPRAREVRDRFAPARWQAFVADSRYFLQANRPDYYDQFRLDHGYNPTPTWTFVARLFSRNMPASRAHFTWLGALDLLLLATMFFAIFRTYRARIGCLALIVFGLGYPWRYDWVGGAFLRHDWLAAVGIGLCLLKRERFVWAGALLGYAAMVRLFPLAFLLGLPVVAAGEFFRGEKPRWFARLCAGVAAAVLVGGLAGGLAGTGLGAWRDFAGNLSKHSRSWLANDVGLKYVVLGDPATLGRGGADYHRPEQWHLWEHQMTERAERRRWLLLGLQAGFLALVVAALRNGRAHEASLLGAALIFILLAPTCYYWSLLALLPLARERWWPTAAWLAINLGLIGLSLLTQAHDVIFGAMSWALALLLGTWCGRAALIPADADSYLLESRDGALPPNPNDLG